MNLKVTKQAADAIIAAIAGSSKSGLRVGIRGGGCSGLSYVLELGSERDNDNIINEHEAKIFVDPKSAVFLEGCILDYVKGLMETGFKIMNPQATKTCGCGESFSI